MQAAAGLHHLMGNHWQILNIGIKTGFEEPLQAELQHYKKVASVCPNASYLYRDLTFKRRQDRSAAYERTLIEKSRIIKKTEAESINTSRRKQRGLPIS